MAMGLIFADLSVAEVLVKRKKECKLKTHFKKLLITLRRVFNAQKGTQTNRILVLGLSHFRPTSVSSLLA